MIRDCHLWIALSPVLAGLYTAVMRNQGAIMLLVGALGAQWATSQHPAAPSLYFRLASPRGSRTMGALQSAELSSSERIHLQICVRARGVEDHFEQPDLAAENKGPEYFAHRPPPNVVLAIRRIDSREDVRFRVISSGGGKSLEVYYVDAEIDLLEEKAVRQQRAEEFVEWMLTEPGGEYQSHLLRAAKPRLVDQFEEQYIHNPVGEYEISARYTPSTPANWAGTLESRPVRFRVVEAVDFFEAIKAKLAVR